MLGVCVVDVKTDSVLIDFNSQVGLAPASSLKIVTCGAALSMLGAGFRYETRLEYDGELDTISGILKGNLYIKGGGDPTLASSVFKSKKDTIDLVNQWARIMYEKKIKKIEGSVIADASVFEDDMIPYSWIWGDLGNYYGAGASGLSYKDNMYTIYFTSGEKPGDSTIVSKISPSIPGMTLKNYVRAGGNDDNCYVYGAPYSNFRYAIGSIPAGKKDFEVNASMPDPPWFCAFELDSALRKTGIEITGKPNTAREIKLAGSYRKTERKKIHSHISPSIGQIIYQTLILSNNLFAEHLLKTIALKKTGIGTTGSGTSLVTSFWKSKGVDTKGFYMADGSGLSRWTSIAPRHHCEMLRAMTREIGYKVFYNSLPIAGKQSSLGSMCKGTRAENNLRAKSGYITRVRSYAGYVQSRNNHQLAFSVIANNYDCSPKEMKQKLEKILILIAELY
jgi:D-alanyl-D-alanine carboxypeptidase/D-alanyl-D-alanine-endopeptidase (penicillin-binding protein 4)